MIFILLNDIFILIINIIQICHNYYYLFTKVFVMISNNIYQLIILLYLLSL